MIRDVTFLLEIGKRNSVRPVNVAGAVYPNLADAKEQAGISEGFGGLAGHWVWNVPFEPNRLSAGGADRLVSVPVKVSYADGDEESVEFERTICRGCIAKIQNWYDSLIVEPVMLSQQDGEQLLLVRFRGPQRCEEPEGYHVAQNVQNDALQDGYVNCVASQKRLHCDAESFIKFVRTRSWYVFEQSESIDRYYTEIGDLSLRTDDKVTWRPGAFQFDDRYQKVSVEEVIEVIGKKPILYFN